MIILEVLDICMVESHMKKPFQNQNLAPDSGMSQRNRLTSLSSRIWGDTSGRRVSKKGRKSLCLLLQNLSFVQNMWLYVKEVIKEYLVFDIW